MGNAGERTDKTDPTEKLIGKAQTGREGEGWLRGQAKYEFLVRASMCTDLGGVTTDPRCPILYSKNELVDHLERLVLTKAARVGPRGSIRILHANKFLLFIPVRGGETLLMLFSGILEKVRFGLIVSSLVLFRARAGASWIALMVFSMGAMIGCDVNSALQRVSQARHLAADLLVQFTKAVDTADRAVMADTDEASVAFAREAEQAKEKVQKDMDALKPLLEGLNYSNESRLLQEFVNGFTEYCELDRRILDLAVENTNLKAQRLSFGPAQEAADSFRDSLMPVAPLVPADKWRVQALVATAVATVREIQVLQAPHIADADEAVMTRMEKSMATSEAAARNALKALSSLVEPRFQARIVLATTALDRFMAVNQEIISLSRRNTNVRSLALSLNQKAKVIPKCENVLYALRDALSKRGFTGTRQ